MQLVSKISNLCGPDPPTSQTDRQTDRQTDGRTDDMQSQYRTMLLHYSASRGKKWLVATLLSRIITARTPRSQERKIN